MPLALLNAAGDLPPGVHQATLDEVAVRFGGPSPQRAALTERLKQIHSLARTTGCVDRFILFGSYITNKEDPNDLDIILVMRDDFRLEACPVEVQVLFNHHAAQSELVASIFWIRPSMLIQEDIDSFIDHWQIKRDESRRGIVEVIE